MHLPRTLITVTGRSAPHGWKTANEIDQAMCDAGLRSNWVNSDDLDRPRH
jgi:hypothetical protein